MTFSELNQQRGMNEVERNMVQEALKVCEAADSHEAVVAANAIRYLKSQLQRARSELVLTKAERDQAIGAIEPPQPAAMLWTDGTAWHAYEQYEDADRDRSQAAKEPPLMVVKEWTWHPKSR